MSEALQRTPLYDLHGELGGKFVSFGGWEMPVQYSGVTAEHLATRTGVGLFDVSHMGEIFVRGADALTYLQQLTPNDLSKLAVGRAQYSLLTMENGGAVDDIIIYRTGESEYLVCVNAANIEKDFRWMTQHVQGAVSVTNESALWAQIAVQGPRAIALLERLYGVSGGSWDLTSFPSFSFRELPIAGLSPRTILARTGYTGEDGGEIFIESGAGAALFRKLLTLGAECGATPCGLGARDTLRLEAALPLYGHELSADRNILEANLGWVVKFDKGEFLGREYLLHSKECGLKEKLVGLKLLEPGIAREECRVFSRDGHPLGETTSGTKTPTVNQSIALAYIRREAAQVGDEVLVEVRGRRILAQIVKLPFYKRTVL